MTRPIIHDGYQQREMTKAEHDEWLELCADVQTRTATVEAAIAAKESAKAKLAALGLTEAEVNAIIGGI